MIGRGHELIGRGHRLIERGCDAAERALVENVTGKNPLISRLLAAASFVFILGLTAFSLTGCSALQSLVSPPPDDTSTETSQADVLDNEPVEEPELPESFVIEKTREKNRAMCPLIAKFGEGEAALEIHTPVMYDRITNMLFHQASFSYALVMSTALPEADADYVASTRSSTVNLEEPVTGDGWLNAQALHLWRTSDYTEMDTSIDIGGAPGTEVYAPVNGTVTWVREYMLFGNYPDIEIHIEPEGHPELDLVILHTENPRVKAGDKIEASMTVLSHLRDISSVSEVQLAYYTPEGDGGNHAHIQINDMNNPAYIRHLEEIRLEEIQDSQEG